MAKRKLSKLQKAYRDFFVSKMEEYEVTSPSQLSDDEKIEFFNTIKKGWKKEKKAMAESYDMNQVILDSLEINEEELSPRQKKFREFFNSKLDEFEVDSPDELDDEQKVEFFNSIDSDWKSLDENEEFETLNEYLEEDDDYNKMYNQTVMDSEDISLLDEDEICEEENTDSDCSDDEKIILFDDEIEEEDELNLFDDEDEENLEEEMTTADIATYDTKISDEEKKQIEEVCKSKGFRLIEAKVIGEDSAKFIVEKKNSNKRGEVLYNDNDRVFPFKVDGRPFSMFESTLDWISAYTFQTDVNAQKHIKEEAKKKSLESLEVEKYKSKTSDLSESEYNRRLDRGAELIEKLIHTPKKKKKTNRPIWGKD